MLQHLRDRFLNLELYRGVTVDSTNQVATFPLWNLSGQMVGYQEYRPGKEKKFNRDKSLMRYYSYVSEGQVGVWGLETLHGPVLFLTEGVFDACRIHNEGLAAIATLTNDPKHLSSFLKALAGSYRLVSVPDNDQAGCKLKAFAKETLPLPVGKDLGEMTSEEVKSLLKYYL